MRVALVVPTHRYISEYPSFLAMSDFPVGFAYIAAALKKAGHYVIGLNPNNCPGYSTAQSMLYEKIKKMLEEQRPQLIGLGGLCTDYAFIKDAIAIIRALAPEIPIVCGGGIITHDVEFVFHLLKPDFCITGDAEEVLVLLLESLATGSRLLESIPNLGFWHNGVARFTAPSFDYPPVETRSFPDYSPFDPEIMIANSALAARSVYRYTRPYPRIMPLVTSRGCPFRCSFCIHQKGTKYRTRPMADILSEIASLYETYHFNILIILDELFAVDKKRLREFCNGIMEGRRKYGWDFEWLFQTHANANLGHHELVMAKEAGCYFFSYGMESASPRVLASMSKKSRPEQIAKAIELASDIGIGFGGNFIFGDIAETPETITETMDFYLKHCMDMHVYVSQISPYPGSSLFDFCQQQGIIGDKRGFYESNSTILYNMTSMPNRAWSEWIATLIWPLDDTFPHVITVEPYEVKLDRSPRDDNGEIPFWLVSSRCPHCNVTRDFREPLSLPAVAGGSAAFLTGCSSCGKRFKVAVMGEGQYSGEVAQRSIPLEKLKTVIHNSIRTLQAPKELIKVLFIPLEFSKWQQARSWGYQANLGFEEGFTANGITFLTVPALKEFSPSDPASWLSHLKVICSGKQFEQVWIEVVHNNLDDTILSYITTLAPVRLAIIGESLKYPEEVYVQAPHLKNRQTEVVHRLKYMTHALACDERDAEWLNRRDTVKALWWVLDIPKRVIGAQTLPVTHTGALFSGALYGEREKWLNHTSLKGLLAQQQPLEEEAQLPELFDLANTQVIDILRSGYPFQEKLLTQHVELLRNIRRQSYALWLKGLEVGSSVVNLPSFFHGYASRVYDGMAAGRPVISWEISDRPRTRALFEDGKEILLFSKDDPEQLGRHILRIQQEPGFAKYLSTNARNKILAYHTTEKRLCQIMKWIETGEEPGYHDEEIIKDGNVATNSFYVDLWNDPAWSSPHPNIDEQARWTRISEFLNTYCFVNGIKCKESFRILDVGCGRGWLSSYLEKYGDYVGIEPVPGAVEIATTLFPGRTFLSGYTGDLLRGTTPKFDIIVSTEVIEHVPYSKQKDFVSDLHALLNNDGLLVLTTPRKEIFDYILNRGLSPQPIEDWLTEDQLERLVESEGFKKCGMERIFYDALTGRFYLSPTASEINTYDLIALYQVWAFKKADQSSSGNKAEQCPLVSVIVPTHNRPDMLKNAIQSILDQTYQNFEIIVVNDAGQDVSAVVQSFKTPKISYLFHETNKGLAATRNTGIRAARGKYIAYLDDDDLFYPEHLETLVKFLENNNCKVAYSDANEALQKMADGEWVVAERSCTYSLEFDAEALLVNNFTPVLCVMHHRDCLDAVGLFDESLRRHEDWEMWLRMSRHFPFAHIKKITCEFTTRDDGLGMREGALPSFLATYRAVCAKHLSLAEGNQRVLVAQQREVYSLLYRSYQFLLKKLMAGADTDTLKTAGATEAQIQSANFMYEAQKTDDLEEKRRFLEQALEADSENVVAREALAANMPESKEQRPAASIVIVTYNSVATLAACIESVARSLSLGDDVVLVDNASRDDTVAMTEQLINGLPAFRIIKNETNAGFSAATNQGILATNNPLVVLLNPDTVVPKNWLNGLSRHRCNNVAAVGPVSNYVAGLQKMELYQMAPLPSSVAIDDVAELFQKWNDGKGVETRLLIGFCMMIQREALAKIGYLDGELFLGNDDLDVSWRLRLNGYQLEVAPDVFVYHAGQVSFSSEPNETTKQLVQESTDHLYRKLLAHYTPSPVPSPMDLWGIGWFAPSAGVLAAVESDRLTKAEVSNRPVSIVILTWNQLPFTQACLESIRRYSPEPYQLIVVDNCSTDGTIPWLREQARMDSRIQLIENNENRGFAAGCNQGIKVAQGELILLLNNDTVVTPGWLSGMRELLDRYPDAGIVGPMTNSASGVQVVANPAYNTLDELPAWSVAFRENNRYRIIRQRRIVGFCMLFRRELVDKIGMLDESFGSGNFEDDDFCLRSELAGYHNMIAGDVFVYHAGGATFVGNRINFAEAMMHNMTLYRAKWNYNRLDETTLRRLVLMDTIQEARRLSMRDETDASIELLIQKGIRVAPDQSAPYIELTEILMAAERYNEALQVVPEMPATTDRMLIHEIEAICHAAQSYDEAALVSANQALERPRALVVLGTIAARSGYQAEAEAFFSRAIDADPSCGSAWLSLGMLQWSRGRQDDAWRALKRSVMVDPLNNEAVKILRDLAERVGRVSEVGTLVAAATHTYPDSRSLALHHAAMLAQCDQPSEALEACESFLVNFGVDDTLLPMALDLREHIGMYDRLAEGGPGSVTLSMIVKDEMKNLAHCLASAKSLVHEIVVVDTGSTDHTADIAAVFGAKVFNYPWQGNFSDARNYAINEARGKWILVMDADEVLSVKDHEVVRSAVREADGNNQAWSVLTRNYTSRVNAHGWTPNDHAYPAEERSDGWHPSWKVRLFPNDRRIRFRGEVHEMVEHSLQQAGFSIKQASFVIHHYGGLNDVKNREKMLNYFELGRQKLEEHPIDGVALQELATQAGELGLHDEAINLWNRLLNICPDNVDALFNKGYNLIRLRRYEESLVVSKKVLEFDPFHKEAAFNYGTCELYAGEPAAAVQILEPISKNNPDYPPLLAVLTLLYLLIDQRGKAVSTLRMLLTLNYAIVDYARDRAMILRTLGKETLAQKLLDECSAIGMDIDVSH